MIERKLLSARDVARALGLHESRIRALAAHGRLPAQKLANRWLFDSDVVYAWKAQSRRRGRPYSAPNSWALLSLASGDEPDWLGPQALRRLRRRLGRRGLQRLLPRLRDRGHVRFFGAPDQIRQKLAQEIDLVPSGSSASSRYGLDIKASGVLDAYVPEGKADALAYRYALRPAAPNNADVILREVRGLWPLSGRSAAPPAAVAADLLDSPDERSQRAGHKLLERLTR